MPEAEGPEHPASYWAATADPHPYPAYRGAGRTEVAVVGGGFTGLSVAYHLARAGAVVHLLEARRVGWGASGRNGGQVLPGMAVGMAELARRRGREAARAAWRLAQEAISRVAALVREEGIDCGFTACGHLEAAYRPAHLEALRRDQAFLAEVLGHPTELLDREAAAERLATPFYAGGLWDPSACAFHPLRYALGLAAGAGRAGAHLFEGSPVTAVSRQGGGWRLTVGKGHTLEAQAVVLAVNGYPPDWAGFLRQRLVRVRSFIIATAAGSAAGLIPSGATVADTQRVLYYFRRTPDDRLLFGGRVRFGAAEDDLQFEALRRGMVRVYPSLAEAPVTHRWSGYVAFAQDRLPHLGRTPDGLWYAAGYAGHGAALSTELGYLLAQALREPSALPELARPLAEADWPPLPLRGMEQHLLPLMGLWLKLLDRVS